MTCRVVFAPEARRDLEDILVYLAPETGVVPARNYVGRIRSYCTGFSTFPERGMRREDIRPSLRLVGYRKKATIAFTVEKDLVTILRIFHRGRNIDFGEDDAGETGPG